MIILDERNYLKPELESKGFSIFDFFENHQVMDLKTFNALELKRRGEFLLVDTQTILNQPPSAQEGFKAVMNTFLGAVFFHEQSNVKAHEWVQNEAAFLTKIIGEYSLPMPQLNWTMLSNQLQFFWNLLEDQRMLQKHMAQFSVELDQVLQNAEVEMVKAKKIHEMLIPRRTDEIKGVSFTNKYAAGEGGGGEFYDLHQTPSKVFQIMVASQSYLISSALLGILGQHREKDFNPAAFLNDAQAEIETINGAKKKKSEVEVTVLELDLGTLELKLHSANKPELHSQLNGRIELDRDKAYKLSKGEKFIVFSPGFIFNWKEGHPNKNIHDFLKSHEKLNASETLSELFFQLKEGKESQFLTKDATVVVMEVNRHGIHKV
ncbi:hypothetical protein ACJVC5_08120 [Peredibacter sp. HCB2-198]|uniref:hypothetical protein n=1 Tax=Peredibacter sp. HCB2-198 TaxID=3383025 RepID=UPI0038B58A19